MAGAGSEYGLSLLAIIRIDPCLSNLRQSPDFESYVIEIEKESKDIPIQPI